MKTKFMYSHNTNIPTAHAKHNEKVISGKKRIVYLITTLLILSVTYALLEPFWIENKIYKVQSPEIPAAIDGKRIIFLTDIHHGNFFSRSRVKSVVKKANSLNPDVILLGGDYVLGSPEFIRPCFDELKNLRAPLGVFGVLGNHDHWQGADLSRKAMTDAGIVSIDNGAFWLSSNEQRIKVGGVGDHCEDTQKVDITVSDVLTSDFVILVSHSPDYAQELMSDKVDLVLSGHTHGGQVTFFNLFAPKMPSRYGQKFRTGIVIINSMQVIISNGLGIVSAPIRFFARPQLAIIELDAH